MTLTLDDSTYEIAARCHNTSHYFSELLTRNWAHWRRALFAAQASGWGNDDILAACKALNGSWLLRDTGFVGEHPALAELTRGRGLDMAPAAALETLAWEYWHHNTELRSILTEPPADDEKKTTKKKKGPKGARNKPMRPHSDGRPS